MNYVTQSFDEFSSSLAPVDIALYAGVGLVLWVVFKDKLSPVQQLVNPLVDKLKNTLGNKTSVAGIVTKPVTTAQINAKNDLFFRLVESWKQTRDLAEQSGCQEAIKVADQMFPYLSPKVCAEAKDNSL
jgi:hypothetical protein